MTSEVSICNLALSHIGDDAVVASIDPPEGSVQAEYCARFYPMVRDALLESANWNFSMGRTRLARLEETPTGQSWRFAYALPGDCMTAISVLRENAENDYSTAFPTPENRFRLFRPDASGFYEPRPFTIETVGDGSKVLFTDIDNTLLRYRRFVTDPTQFSPLFSLALSWSLAAALAGPIIKGAEGAAMAQRCAQFAEVYLAKAKNSDANERDIPVKQAVPWMAQR